MSQFLKKKAKLIYLIMFAFSLFIFVSSTVYITEYNDTALNYKENVLEDPSATTATNNDFLYAFITDLKFFEDEGIDAAEFNFEYGNFKKNDSGFKKVFRAMFDFNQDLQKANNSIFYLGLFSMAMIAVMCICANASRKKYYISNLVSGIVCPGLTIGFSLTTLLFNVLAMVSLSQSWELINWGALANKNLPKVTYSVGEVSKEVSPVVQWYIEKDTSHFELSYNTLIIYSIFLGVFIISNALLIVYNVWRYKETRRELSLEGLGE